MPVDADDLPVTSDLGGHGLIQAGRLLQPACRRSSPIPRAALSPPRKNDDFAASSYRSI
jgi:hypothetical protein